MLRKRRIGLNTQREPVVLLRADGPVCRAEGLATRSQVLVRTAGKTVTATLFQEAGDRLAVDEIGLSDAAWSLLDGPEDERVLISPAPPLESMGRVRQRIFGEPLDRPAMADIVGDVVAGRYSDVQLAAFLTAGSALPLSDEETYALTRAMTDVGDKLSWPHDIVVDKHSVGGLPGNRTTPIVVSIVAACGLVIPKTSSRAITSPAGTADAMATVTKVDLDLVAMRRVVEREGGCLIWGGAVNLSPADDIFIGVERQLDIDTEGHLIASVLSKKAAAGASHVILDMPVGPTSKVRSDAAADLLSRRLVAIAARLGLEARCLRSDGTQPVGRAIGPALEMMDVLAVLRGAPDAPSDLRDRAITLAAAILELGGAARPGHGVALAELTLRGGQALTRFERICCAQGGFREPARARRAHVIPAPRSGRVMSIDNRRIARLAKLTGAPDLPVAGLRLHARLDDGIEAGAPLVTLYAETQAELEYALDYAAANPDIIRIEA